MRSVNAFTRTDLCQKSYDLHPNVFASTHKVRFLPQSCLSHSGGLHSSFIRKHGSFLPRATVIVPIVCVFFFHICLLYWFFRVQPVSAVYLCRTYFHAAALDVNRGRCFLQVDKLQCNDLLTSAAVRSHLSHDNDPSSVDRSKLRSMNVFIRIFGHALDRDKLTTRISKQVSVGYKQQIAPIWNDRLSSLLRYNNLARLSRAKLFIQVLEHDASGDTILGCGLLPMYLFAPHAAPAASSSSSPNTTTTSGPASASATPVTSSPAMPTSATSAPSPVITPPDLLTGSSPHPSLSFPPPSSSASPSPAEHSQRTASPPPLPPKSPPVPAKLLPPPLPHASPMRGEKLSFEFQCPLTLGGQATGVVTGVLTLISGWFDNNCSPEINEFCVR